MFYCDEEVQEIVRDMLDYLEGMSEDELISHLDEWFSID
jgi:hypothetical protein